MKIKLLDRVLELSLIWFIRKKTSHMNRLWRIISLDVWIIAILICNPLTNEIKINMVDRVRALINPTRPVQNRKNRTALPLPVCLMETLKRLISLSSFLLLIGTRPIRTGRDCAGRHRIGFIADSSFSIAFSFSPLRRISESPLPIHEKGDFGRFTFIYLFIYFLEFYTASWLSLSSRIYFWKCFFFFWMWI